MKTQTETRPVCAGAPDRGFPQHAPVAMYRSGYTPPPDSKTRFKCPTCGRTVSGHNAEILFTTVSIQKETAPRRKKKRRPSKGMYDL